MGEAFHESLIHGVADPGHDDGNRGGRLLDVPDRRRARRNDKVDLPAHQLPGQFGQPLDATFGGAVLDGEIRALVQAALGETRTQILEEIAVGIDERRQDANDRPLLR